MQGGTEKNAACLRHAIRRHCHAFLISQARLTVDLGALSCGGQARFSSVIGTLPISLARLISRARLTVDPGALYAVASGALSCGGRARSALHANVARCRTRRYCAKV